jgi:hypothetical protein
MGARDGAHEEDGGHHHEAQECAGDGAGLEHRARALAFRCRRRAHGTVPLADRFEAFGADEFVDAVPAAVGGLPAAVRAVEACPAPGRLLDE